MVQSPRGGARQYDPTGRRRGPEPCDTVAAARSVGASVRMGLMTWNGSSSVDVRPEKTWPAFSLRNPHWPIAGGSETFSRSHENFPSPIVSFRQLQLGSSSGEGSPRPLPPPRGCVGSVTTRMTILRIVQRKGYISPPEPNTINHPIHSASENHSKC